MIIMFMAIMGWFLLWFLSTMNCHSGFQTWSLSEYFHNPHWSQKWLRAKCLSYFSDTPNVLYFHYSSNTSSSCCEKIIRWTTFLLATCLLLLQNLATNGALDNKQNSPPQSGWVLLKLSATKWLPNASKSLWVNLLRTNNE